MEVSILYDLTLRSLRTQLAELKSGSKPNGQFIQDMNLGFIVGDVARCAYENDLWAPSERPRQVTPESLEHHLPDDDKNNIAAIAWRLVGSGILVPRSIGTYPNQFFLLTPYGRQVLDEDEATPYDPFGFIQALRRDAPALEPDTVELVGEALDCFLARHTRASAILIGIASELEILKLVDLCRTAADEAETREFDKQIKKAASIKAKFDALAGRLGVIKSTLPRELQELDVWLNGVFQIIRLQRNDAGHPTGYMPSHESVYAHINLFLGYARRISMLKEHLRKTHS